MESIGPLLRTWDEQKRFQTVQQNLTFTDHALILGVGTPLLKAHRGRFNPVGSEDRITFLLRRAYRAVFPDIIPAITRAAAAWNAGERCLAQIHLALARMPPLDPDAGARRLFFAAGLLEGGLTPETIAKIAGYDGHGTILWKQNFNALEPRERQGDAHPGRWTRTGGGHGHGRVILVQQRPRRGGGSGPRINRRTGGIIPDEADDFAEERIEQFYDQINRINTLIRTRNAITHGPKRPPYAILSAPDYVPTERDIDRQETMIRDLEFEIMEETTKIDPELQDKIEDYDAKISGLRDRIETEIQYRENTGGRVIRVTGPDKMSSNQDSDPSLGPLQGRYYARFRDEFGKETNYSINYDPISGHFGTIKPSSRQGK